MPPVGFEPTIPASERPQTYALDRAATETGKVLLIIILSLHYIFPIVKRIKGQRISCLGHLERMEEDRMPKKIFTQELEGTRSRGRPRKDGKRK